MVMKRSISVIVLFFLHIFIIVGCQSNYEGKDLIRFLEEENITAKEIIEANNTHYIFYEKKESLGIYVLKGKDNGKFVYGHANNESPKKVFLGSGEKNSVGLIVLNHNLLKKTAYIKITRNDETDLIPFVTNKKYYVLNSKLISNTYDYTLYFYDAEDTLIFEYGQQK